MKIQYEVITEERVLEGIRYIAYGILIQDENTDTVIRKISDISLDYDEIRKLADLCNIHSLSVEHIEDIVQDFLSV